MTIQYKCWYKFSTTDTTTVLTSPPHRCLVKQIQVDNASGHDKFSVHHMIVLRQQLLE